MRWIRSFPDVLLPNRAYVVDDLPRLITSNYDYTPLGPIDDDVCLIEWDIALEPAQVVTFEYGIRKYQYNRPVVAAHRLYHVADQPVWAHRTVDPRNGLERWIEEGEPFCDYFAFGLIYLPREIVRAFLEAPAPARGTSPWIGNGVYLDERFTDQTFSVWYRHHYIHTRPVPVLWDVRPVHLHGK